MRETTTKIKKTLELIKEDEDWLQDEMPGISSWWIHQKLMEAFRFTYEQSGVRMEDYIKSGAEEVKNLFMLKEE